MSDAPNAAAFEGELIIEELVRLGVHTYFVCPGARSAPLVRALARREDVRATIVLDERGAGFAAVGFARATARPAAVITTSGTAAVNLHPAIAEASSDAVPLLVLTADRPPELRDTGANQTMRQSNLYGDLVRWRHEIAGPASGAPARSVLTALDHALAMATGAHPGPVHLNVPFREPLDESPAPWSPSTLDGLDAWEGGDEPFTQTETAAPAGHDAAWLGAALTAGARGLLLVGDLPGGCDRVSIRALAERLGWPTITDARSGLRGGAPLATRLTVLERAAHPGGLGDYEPDVVLQLGARLTSKRLLSLAGSCEWIVVDPRPARLDPAHAVTARVFASPDAWAEHALAAIADAPGGDGAEHLRPLATQLRGAMDAAIDAESRITEPFVARHVTAHTPEGHGLFLSSSLPIREVESFGVDDGPDLQVAANRGMSGIDGIIASAAGFALGHGRPVTLLIGDVAAVHDANALELLAREELPVTLVVLDNGGGGIFHFLPLAADGLVTPWFDSPHRVRFAPLADAFGIPHERVESADAFADAYARAVEAGAPRMIVVASDARENHAVHVRIDSALRSSFEDASGE